MSECERRKRDKNKKGRKAQQTSKQTKEFKATTKFSRENKLTLKQMDFSMRLDVTIKLYERDMQIVDYESIEANRII